MRTIAAFFNRLFSFFQKEIMEVLRQPKLILTLIFGPFLILLLFGLGYSSVNQPLRTMFIAKPENPLVREIEGNSDILDAAITVIGFTENSAEAEELLRRGGLDIGIILPDKAMELVQANQQATFTVLHNEIDPVQVNYINYISRLYVDEVNRRVLSTIAQQGQGEAGNVSSRLDKALASTRAMRAALEAGNAAEANAAQAAANQELSSLELAVGASMALRGSLDPNQDKAETLDLLKQTRSNPSLGAPVEEGKGNYDVEIASLHQAETDMVELQAQLQDFREISPQIMVSPFTAKVESVSPVEFQAMDFFVPGVIVLLIQHVMVTLGALSIVREKRSGTMELFRVSPIKAGEILFGKYLSYAFIGIFVTAILGVLLKFGLRVPMLGDWVDAGLVLLALIFASLGIGFFISLIASTESQAVQFSMITLLFSVFFAGFFLDLRFLLVPVKYVSNGIPATYGTRLMQSIMLRGQAMDLNQVLALLAIGLIFLALSWVLLAVNLRKE